MDPYRNPFAPGAGSRPPELAGRDDILEAARLSCGRAVRGRSARSLMLLGLRGTGKTVLLNEIGRIAEEEGLLVSKVEAPEGESLARLLHPEMRKVLRSLSTIEAAKHLAGRGLGEYLAGTLSATQFAQRLSMEWASLPCTIVDKRGRPATGQSYYAGDGLNKSHVTIPALMAAVRAVKTDARVSHIPKPAPQAPSFWAGIIAAIAAFFRKGK